MAFRKKTMIAGTKNGDHKTYFPGHGYWSPEAALRYARNHGMVGKVRIEHRIYDMSGGGRGGHNGRWVIDEYDNITKEADWSEFGKEHK